MFTININEVPGPLFNIIFNSFKGLIKKTSKNYTSNVFSKIFRTAILAGTLWKEGQKTVKIQDEGNAENECVALLYESFIFYTRIVYDVSTDILQNYTKNLTKSYNELIKKIKKGDLGEINGELREYLKNDSAIFRELKDIRDSLKRNASADVYVEGDKYYVSIKYYDKKEKISKILKQKLSSNIFKHCIFLGMLAINLTSFINYHENNK